MPSTNTTTHIHHHDLAKKSFRIKQDDKFFTRLLSKEASQPNSSCRIYYGEAAVAVPFVWESQPGTPKHTLFENSSDLPPLTPPPSYTSSNASKSMHRSATPSSKPKLLLLSTIFPKKEARKTRKLSQPSSLSLSSLSSSSTSSSSSWSNFSASASSASLNKKKADQKRSRWLSADLAGSSIPFDYGAVYDDHDHDHHDAAASFRSPNPTLCFPVTKKTWDFLAGCYGMGNMKIGRRVV